MGLWLTIFLIEHLLTNSQAALFVGDSGSGFVKMVDLIHNLPYLEVFEVFLFVIPIGLHAYYGVQYALRAKDNSGKSDGSTPSLPQYGRNRAYSWQRITSWILLVMLLAHVVKFRFIEYPESVAMGSRASYFVRVETDSGLYTLAQRMHAKIYDATTIKQLALTESKIATEGAPIEQEAEILRERQGYDLSGPTDGTYSLNEQKVLEKAQEISQNKAWFAALTKRRVDAHQVIVETDDFGSATLFSVRNTFKYPIYVALYTVFVLAACFHAFNGLWTFMISWGVVIRVASQKMMRHLALTIMALISLLGLAAIWGTYFLNLRY